ncbi:ephexin-1 isoform X2 [Alosa sapidissima]|uniref:ephexin-1 isoform X2 n=1 Tax=Alosa sapidissima TaxID=34773 RepID=UPI001C091F96|nr:ephexin-1 isoform X2 [Alosa sapidissima]
MSTNSNINKPTVPPRPQVPPKPDLWGAQWRRSTDVILRTEAGEEGAQDRKRQLAKHKSLPAVVNGSPTLNQSADLNPGQANAQETPASPVRVRPVPKPRRRRTAQNSLSLSGSSVDREMSILESQSTGSSTYNPSETTATQFTCHSSCPCACHRTPESIPKPDAHKLPYMPPAPEDYTTHLEYWHIVQPEKRRPSRTPPSIPLPCLPLLEVPEPLLPTTGESEEPEILEAVYMEVASDESTIQPVETPTFQNGNTRSSPCSGRKSLPSMMNMNCKITDKIHPDHQDMGLICDVLLGEIPQKVYQHCQEKQDTDPEKPKGKRKKLSPLELLLSPFQSKHQAKRAADQKDSTTTCDIQTSSKQDSLQEHSPKEISVSNPDKKPGAKENTCLSSSEEETEGCKLDDSKIVPSRGRLPTLEGLWQERSIVKKKGILSQLSKEQLLLQESLFEVVTTEHTYLKSLDVVVEHFLESPELNQVLEPRDRKSLFSGISRIRQMSQNFLQDMKEELNSNLFCDTCKVIQRYATGPFGAYVDYIRNMPYQEQTLHHLEQRSPQIIGILRKLQEDPRCNRLSLKSYLVLPFQRITRLKILVEAILKKTEPGSQGQASAERALKGVSKIVEACNREVGKMKQMEEMVRIANKTEFECKALPLVSSSRWLLKQGELAQLSAKENIFGQRKLFPIYLFLFNDLLLLTTRKGPDRFVVRDHAHRSLVEINSVEDDENLEGCERDRTFQLALLKNQRGSTSHLLLQAPSQTEKASWMGMLTKRKEGDEEIYEEWDCPQVQCTVAYQARHQGELSLQLGDIINVIQKTTEGFLEGWRVDGERGWFPAACTVEITNEHVQRRHLRQRYHVMQAANRVLCRRLGNDKTGTACFR